MSTDALPRLSFTRAEAAQVCGVSEDTIARAVKAGTLRAKQSGKRGGKHLYMKADLEAWLNGLEDA